jgi:hypothetical protein
VITNAKDSAVDIAIKKVGHRDGTERFILVNNKTRQVITVSDVSEKSLRRFCRERGFSDQTVDNSLARARKRYDETPKKVPVSETADTIEGDDLLFQLGLEEDSNTHQ